MERGNAMRRLLGWLGMGLAIVMGVIAAGATVYLFAAHAPRLWVLAAAGIVAAAIVGAMVARITAGWAGVARTRASVVVAVLAAMPLLVLMAVIGLTPKRTPFVSQGDLRGPHEQVRVDTGSSLAVWRVAPAQRRHATPVVFLHGGPGSYVRQRDIEVGAQLREAGYETVYFDQAGSGASADLPILTYSISRSVADLDGLRKHLGAERLVLWGQSWGASLAAAYARAHPDRVAGAIFESPGDLPGEPATLDHNVTDQVEAFSPTPRDATLYLLINYAPQLADEWLPQQEHHAYNDAIGASRAFRGYQCKGAPAIPRPASSGGSSLYTHQRLLRDMALQPRISEIDAPWPALVIRGDCDFITAATAERYADAFDATLLKVPGVGHGLFGHDAQLAALLGDFANGPLAEMP